LLGVWLGVWLLTVYASFWVRPGTLQTELAVATGLHGVAGQDAGPSYARVLALDPRNAIAMVSLTELDKDAGHLARAAARLEEAAQTTTNAMIDTALAGDLAGEGRLAEAIEWARRACGLTLDYAPAPALLCELSLRAGQNEQAVRAGAAALRLEPWDDEVHFNVGVAWARLRRYPEAAGQLADAVVCKPRRADAHYELGLALWRLPGRKAEARDHVATAVRLSPQNAQWKSALAKMQQEMNMP
jgi:tetratricopeptide (TPR) repeat protein